MSALPPLPALRLRRLNEAPLRPDGRYVLYWMTAARRLQHNAGLQRAAELARELGRPLLVLEALRIGYPHASPRLHRFVLDGMADNARIAAGMALHYYPYVEPEEGAGKGLLAALAAEACAVVSDTFPTFFIPRMLAAAADKLPVRLEAADSCGLLPLAATERAYPTAYAFRRMLQKVLLHHLPHGPAEDPLAGPALPRPVAPADATLRRWPAANPALLAGAPGTLERLPLPGDAPPVDLPGGSSAGLSRWAEFLRRDLSRYAAERNHPDAGVESGISPYLHFGHVSAHALVHALLQHEGWSEERIAPPANGRRAGFWGLSEGGEALFDQLVTWRELGFNGCWHRPEDHAHYEALPGWALQTLEQHRVDPRPELYSDEQLERARTGDPLWNAAQRQLLGEGKIHNYLRMLWGKKILQWSVSPKEALRRMLTLNDRHALDGRDPNSVSGIFWVLGRYDRAWGPQRPIFGKVRYMTSDSARRKLKLKKYLARWGRGTAELPL